MKTKLFFLLALLSMASLTRAQDSVRIYQSIFGDSITKWRIFGVAELEGFHGGGAGTACWENTNTDTMVIDHHNYRLLKYLSDESLLDFWSPGFKRADHLFRENDNHSQLYYRSLSRIGQPSTLSPEILLMDMDMQVGDTVDTTNWARTASMLFSGIRIPTIIIDSVFYRDGRKVLRTDYYNHTRDFDDTLYFIEGIGPSYGLFYEYKDYILTSIICYERDGSTIYHGKMYGYENMGDGCNIGWVTSGVQSASLENNVTLSPNPCDDYFVMEGDNIQSAALYDIRGTLVIPHITAGQRVPTAALPRGLYYLRVVAHGTTTSKPLIKY